MIEAARLDKRFGAFNALEEVSFQIGLGEAMGRQMR